MAEDGGLGKLIRRQTKQILESGQLDGKGVDAYTLSVDLKQDRSNISRSLNRLWREGVLIKFQGKPTLFLDRKLVEEHFPGVFVPQTVAKGESLSALLKAAKEQKEQEKEKPLFDQLTGAAGSLQDAIRQAKAAAAYPPCGLHTLLVGPSGVGKKQFASCICQYRKELTHAASFPMVTVPCYTFAENPRMFGQRLLGLAKSTVTGKPVKGVLEEARDGLLFLDGIEYLPPASLSLLERVLAEGSYSRIGDLAIRPLTCMIVASTCQEPSGPLGLVAEYFPMSIRLPRWEERPAKERVLLVLEFFLGETEHFGVSARVSRGVILCLSSLEYDNQLLQLSNLVKTVCARALMDCGENHYQTVTVRLEHLPEHLLDSVKTGAGEEALRHVTAQLPDQYVELNRQGIARYIQDENMSDPAEEERVQELLNLALRDQPIDDLYHTAAANIACLAQMRGGELETVRGNIFPIVLQVVTSQLYKCGKLERYREHLHLLYGVLLHISNALKRNAALPALEPEAASKESLPEEYELAKGILDSLGQIYGQKFSNREIDYLASYLAIFSNWINTVNTGILVVCHGEGTASGLVSYALRTIREDYVIDAVNYSASMSLLDCMKEVARKARHLDHGSGVLIVTDMEPLTSLHEYVTRETGIEAHIVYPVTLPLLLELIRQIVSNRLDYSSLLSQFKPYSRISEHMGMQEEFIRDLEEKVITKTAVFMDTKKAVLVLEKCLRATLLELNRPYSNEIAAKYLCHCCNMLERVIRRETWNYTGLNHFINEHHDLMQIIEHKLEYVENIFGIKIPPAELAYITEIFL